MQFNLTVTCEAVDVPSLRADLKALREQLGLLGTDHLVTAIEAPDEDALDALRVRNVNALWPRIGTGIRSWLREAANVDGPWTNQDLAERLGVDNTTIRSHSGNLGRTMKGIYRDFGEDTSPDVESPTYPYSYQGEGKY